MLKDIFAKALQGELYNYQKIVKKINFLENSLTALSNEELKAKTIHFKNLINDGRSLDEILPEAFAVVKEASWRVLKIKHYDVQLIGGCILHDGKIAEMKTGEGKTLVAILPAYLNALTGKSVHIVTVNEYLAKRDSLSVGKVLSFLGLEVGLILAEMDNYTRKSNYNCDVIYSTNSELGFDYLRDNMITEVSEKVQRDFTFAIVDEVDSVLIDEARTPLIISQSIKTPDLKYLRAKSLSEALIKDTHYEVDKKDKNVFLTEDGVKVSQYILGVSSLYKFEKPWALYILNAIRAKELYIRDKDYLVAKDQILIIDEYTGRVLSGRRWGEGLHQAIEAKESIPIESETMSLASITYQNFFLLYDKLSGMTGTALSEEKEFKKIYDLCVDCVPTNKKINRIDEDDVIYKSLYAKWKAVLFECLKVNSEGRPVLIGTSSVESSEIISSLLKEYNVKHNLLNAKPENAAKESEIVAQAGRKYAVTIATNMAGRGTDILLGGNAGFLAKDAVRSIIRGKFNSPEYQKFNDSKLLELMKNFQREFAENKKDITEVEILIESLDALFKPENIFEQSLQNLYKEVKIYYERECNLEKEEVVRLGGLHIIGTEKNESRRIDNQLRGRAGRQGDPGSSKFFLSFEDSLLQVFGGDNLKNMMSQLDLDDDQPIKGKMVSSSIVTAQKKIEEKNFETRKRLFTYDKVLNNQRKVIYAERNRFLNFVEIKALIFQYLEKTVDEVIEELDSCKSEKVRKKILGRFRKNFICLPYVVDSKSIKKMSKKETKAYLSDQIKIAYELKELELESLEVGLSESLEYSYLLQSIDQVWQDHLSRMNLMKENIGWRSYGQRDPLLEYQKEAYRIFTRQTRKIRQNACYLIMCTTSFV